MASTDPNVLEVRVTNSENSTAYYLYVRRDRLSAFYQFLMANRCPDTPKGMPGLSWAAMMGLDAIFEKRPRKFPVYDIINFLVEDYHSIPPATAPEIERVLEQFASHYPPDVAESA